MAKNWIAGAIGKKGALHRQMGVPIGQKIPAGRLAKAAKSPGLLGKRARLAQTLKGLHPPSASAPALSGIRFGVNSGPSTVMSHLPNGVGQSPSGDIGQHRQVEGKIAGGFSGPIVSASKYFTTRYKGV